ncbi:hypothetical protein Salmuc_03460 [Salipiger mucosus DSM 16094]|uniref:Uncharacterized protein n=2 Tax=Salipiger mucosus TaxID=263378 RepID=S9RVW2_9RHOB|nr:hypothetical protein Salmuc_03460 [Salipiger mucosus DSM 16094]
MVRSSGVLVSRIPDKSTDFIGIVDMPGRRVFNGLVRKGLIFETEEDPVTLPDGTEFEFTPSMELTDEGEALCEDLFGSASPDFKF